MQFKRKNTIMTTIDTHTYWTTMAFEVLPSTATAATQDKWDEHKFGLCDECNCGLDDESDFVVHEYTLDTVYLCIECWLHPCPWS